MPIIAWLTIVPAISLIVIHLMWWSDSRKSPDHNVVQHVLALVVGIVLLGGGVTASVVASEGEAKADDKSDMKDMQVIEASLAMKKEKKKVQPQKEFREPDPVKKPDGVSHDEKKKVEEKKKDEEKPKPQHKDDPPIDPKDLKDRFKHPTDDDQPVGKPITNIGEFNGSEHGFAAVTKGDPYLQALLADMAYTPPAIAKDEGTPVGCIHITPEGRIPETKFMESTTGDFQTAAEIALAQLKKTRNDNPKAVPDNLLPLTTKWLCFKFTAAAQ